MAPNRENTTPNREETGEAAASAAGKVLSNPNSPPDAKKAAASALAQTPDKTEKGDKPKK